ncbi:MAG: hypothetical protein NVSMB57_00790 [Actinomycetota bacterium]
MSPVLRGRFRLLAGVTALAIALSAMAGSATVPRQGWTPASFGMLAECGKARPPVGYLFPGGGCLYTTRIKFSHTVPGLALAGTLGHGLWMSAGGESWTPLAPQCLAESGTLGNLTPSAITGKDGLTACGIEDFAFDPQDPKTIYAAGMNVGGFGQNSFHFDEGGVFKSEDQGTSWTNLTKGRVQNVRAASLAVIHDPGKKAVIMTGNIQRADHDVGVSRSLAISSDDGATWRSVTFKPPRGCRNDDVASSPHLVASLTVHPQNSNVVFAGTNGGLYVTFDQGRTWKLAYSHCVATRKFSIGSVWAVAFSPDGKQVYTAAWDGVVRVASVARPTAWKTVVALPGMFITSIIPDSRDASGKTYFAAAVGAYPGAGRDAAGVYRITIEQNRAVATVLKDSYLAGPNHYLGPVPVRPYELVKSAPALSLAQSTLDSDMLFLSQVSGGIYWRSEGVPGPNPTKPEVPAVPGLPTAKPTVTPPSVPTSLPTALPTPTVTPTH